MAMLMLLLPNFEIVMFKLRQKLRKDLNNQSTFKLHTDIYHVISDSKAAGNLIVRASM